MKSIYKIYFFGVSFPQFHRVFHRPDAGRICVFRCSVFVRFCDGCSGFVRFLGFAQGAWVLHRVIHRPCRPCRNLTSGKFDAIALDIGRGEETDVRFLFGTHIWFKFTGLVETANGAMKNYKIDVDPEDVKEFENVDR